MSKAIMERFEQFVEQHGEEAFTRINEFLDQERERFNAQRSAEDAVKTRQGWVNVVGSVLEDIVRRMLQQLCDEWGIHITDDRKLKNPKEAALRCVRENITVALGAHDLLPDGDIILYCPTDCRVIAILSIKNSFRERYTETPYWKLKLAQHAKTRHVRVFMITPDRDGEVSFTTKSPKPRKARIVMEHELDGIYLARSHFDPSPKVKSIAALAEDLKVLFQESACS